MTARLTCTRMMVREKHWPAHYLSSSVKRGVGNLMFPCCHHVCLPVEAGHWSLLMMWLLTEGLIMINYEVSPEQLTKLLVPKLWKCNSTCLLQVKVDVSNTCLQVFQSIVTLIARTRQDIVSDCDVTTRRNISFITCLSVCLWISQQPTLFNHFTTYGNNIGNVKAILTAIVHVLRVTVLSTAYYIWSLPCLLQSSRVDMFCACWGFLRVPRHTFQRQTGDSLLATGQYVSMSTAHLRAVDLSKV